MNLWLRNLLLLALMLAASGLAIAMRPTHKIADQESIVDLERVIPRAFGPWQEEKQSSVQIVDPEQKKMLDQIYSQMLSRTYVNAKGYRIMLSLAYGNDQTRDMQVHRPEVCYVAQGFQVGGGQKIELKVNGYSIPAMQLETRLEKRIEPVTYWVRVGSEIARGNIELGLARISYGIRGQIAHGLLFRVSSLDGDAANAYAEQEEFVDELIKAMPLEARPAIIGGLKDQS